MLIAVIDYGMGNVASVQKGLNYLGIPSKLTRKKEEIEQANGIILPGVGAFTQGMENLKAFGLIPVLNGEVLVNKKPILGICLGMQLLATYGTEIEHCKGLGYIDGVQTAIQEENKVIPHLGWNEIKVKSGDRLERFDQKDFYFIHSFHFKVKNPRDVTGTVNYGKDYVAIVRKGHIVGVQFHPEKSQKLGLEMLSMLLN